MKIRKIEIERDGWWIGAGTLLLGGLLIITVLVLTCGNAHGAEAPIDWSKIPLFQKTVALTLIGEAAGEGKEGIYAVGCVIQERSIKTGLRPSRICKIPKWFSVWNGTSRASLENKFRAPLWQHRYAIELAKQIVDGKPLKREVVKNANHYCTLETHPNQIMTDIVVIGHHQFYKAL